ncbi:MAG: ABC transporter, ATP binding protein [Candidatus Syntrophoarchaeum butanivorans]|uniref:ABC transporter, ATP binding protein n=5 Tax=Candidatus Syntropharchaeum butanivorans TaxID=1839936 RepID=A0A1F2P3W9_9EURY|nr:MAG: ABC transporter, ATP binding protein [Candidatus Syntrophoarchaeum butanivorans]OFV66091.1 MAG: ABC transporter, ATP binding protein [Candidatus Syntrophoarchaeum butanivorans]
MSKNEDFITVEGLRVYMGGVAVLDDINFRIKEGEGFGILGKSGSGKSVLMHSMRGTREYKPDKGSIIYRVALCPNIERCGWAEPPSRAGEPCPKCGQILEIKEVNIWDCDPQLRHNIYNRLSLMMQRTFAIYGEMAVIQNIEEALKDIDYPKEKRVAKIMELLNRVELVHRSLHIARDLSGGEKQRVVLARHLALDPIALYADEPTGTLDPITADTVHRVLRQEIERGMTMIITSHWLHAIEQLTDHGIVLEDGRIIAAGKTTEISEKLRGGYEEFERGEIEAAAPKVKIENCSKSFYVADRGGMVHAVKNINLTINEGEIFGIVGVSGAGKTTLGKMLAGLQTTSSGRILIRIGDDWIDMNEPGEYGRGRATPYISILHQEYGLYHHSTIVENLTDSIGLTMPAEIARMKAREILKMVGFDEKRIDDILQSMPDELGVGEQHRIALARALMTEPDILILDEPTGTIDSLTLNDVIRAILRSRKELNQTYIIMSHDVDFVERVCDRAMLMSGGEMVKVGEPSEIVKLFKEREKVMGA